MNKKALIELGKSFGRFIWFGLLGLIGTFLANLLASGDLSNVQVVVLGQNVNLTIALTLVIGYVIKAIDRYRHVSPYTSSNGLAPPFLQK